MWAVSVTEKEEENPSNVRVFIQQRHSGTSPGMDARENGMNSFDAGPLKATVQGRGRGVWRG